MPFTDQFIYTYRMFMNREFELADNFDTWYKKTNLILLATLLVWWQLQCSNMSAHPGLVLWSGHETPHLWASKILYLAHCTHICSCFLSICWAFVAIAAVFSCIFSLNMFEEDVFHDIQKQPQQCQICWDWMIFLELPKAVNLSFNFM